MKSAISRTSLRRMLAYALLTALGIVFSRILAIDAGVLRFNLGSVPPLLAGIWFGPAAGALVGAVADMLGGLMVGYTLNPVITAGAASIGLVAGLVWRYLPGRESVRLTTGVFAGHIVGSLCINSLALHLFYSVPWPALAMRIPTYLILSAIESAVILLLMRSRGLRESVEKLK